VKCKNESDNSNNRSSWNHLKIIQKIPEQHTWTARNQDTTENSHTGHCTRTAGSNEVNVPNIQHGK
jgi:hypothetical protein